MSDYHVITQSADKKTVMVIWHIPIPSANNSAGVNYRTALVDYLEWTTGKDPIESNCPNVTAGELTQIQAGELYELNQTYRFSSIDPPLSNPEKAAELDAEFTRLTTDGRNKFEVQLEWWGLNRDV